MEKVNFPENSVLHEPILPDCQKKQNKKIFYYEYFVIGLVIEASNLHQDVSSTH